MSAVAFQEVGCEPEYRDATYEPIDQWGYITFYPCLVLGLVGPFVKILVWQRLVGDYVEYVVELNTITFQNPAHKTELLMLIQPVADYIESVMSLEKN